MRDIGLNDDWLIQFSDETQPLWNEHFGWPEMSRVGIAGFGTVVRPIDVLRRTALFIGNTGALLGLNEHPEFAKSDIKLYLPLQDL